MELKKYGRQLNTGKTNFTQKCSQRPRKRESTDAWKQRGFREGNERTI